MPYLNLTVSKELLESSIAWEDALVNINQNIADNGWANLNAIKSYITQAPINVTGADTKGLLILINLTLTIPRANEVVKDIGEFLVESLSSLVSSNFNDRWVEISCLVNCAYSWVHVKKDFNKPE